MVQVLTISTSTNTKTNNDKEAPKGEIGDWGRISGLWYVVQLRWRRLRCCRVLVLVVTPFLLNGPRGMTMWLW